MSSSAMPPPTQPPMPPPMPPEPADLAERRSWALDAFDTITDAQQAASKERGDVGRLGDLYILVFGVVLVLAMGFSGMAGLFEGDCPGCGLPVVRPLLALGLVVGAAGAIALGACVLGPIGLSPARRSFLGSAPADRAVVVRGPLISTAIGAALVGVVAGGAAGLATIDVTTHGVLPVVLAALVGAAAGADIVLLAVTTQPWAVVAQGLRRLGAALLVLGAIALVMAVLAGDWTTRRPGPDLGSTETTAILVTLLPVLVVAGVVLARLVPALARQIRGVDLARGGDVAQALLTSTLSLDLAATATLADERSRARRGRHASRRLRIRGPAAVAVTDLRRVRRGPGPLLVAAAVVAVPAVLTALAGPTTGVVVATLAGIAVANSTAGGLRLWTRSSSMQRTCPAGRVTMRLSLMAAPALVSTVWLGAVFALGRLDGAVWSVVVVAVYAAVLRCAHPSQMAAAAGLVAVTPMGAVPVGIIAALSRGPDVAVVPVGLALLGYPGIGFVIAGLLCWWQLVHGVETGR